MKMRGMLATLEHFAKRGNDPEKLHMLIDGWAEEFKLAPAQVGELRRQIDKFGFEGGDVDDISPPPEPAAIQTPRLAALLEKKLSPEQLDDLEKQLAGEEFEEKPADEPEAAAG